MALIDNAQSLPHENNPSNTNRYHNNDMDSCLCNEPTTKPINKMKTKYVWLNIRTGEFSESFTKEEFDKRLDNDLETQKIATRDNWTCLEYTTHFSDFTFCDRMKIIDKSVNNALLNEGANKIEELQAKIKQLIIKRGY